MAGMTYGICETIGCWKVKWLTASGKCERCEAKAAAASHGYSKKVA